MTDEEKDREEIAESFSDREEAGLANEARREIDPGHVPGDEGEQEISDEIEQDPISEQVAEEETIDNEGDIKAENDVVAALQVAEVAEGPEIEPEPEDEDEAEESVDEGIEIVVDGQKMRVPSKAIFAAGLRTLQKESAADVRLEQASNLKREAEETLEKARVKAQSIAPTPEERAVVREIATRFEATYPELAGDEYLKTLTIMEADRRLQQGEDNSWAVYDESAKAVKAWHGRIASERVTKQQFQQKLDRKAAVAGATILGVNAKTETLKVEPKPQSNSDIILEMRKARGQAI